MPTDSTTDGETPESATPLLSPLASPLRVFLEFSEAAESLVHLTHQGLPYLVHLHEGLLLDGDTPDQVLAHAAHDAKYAQLEIDRRFSTVHAVSLLGLWGAMECFVENVFVAMVSSTPVILSGKAFEKVKLPANVLGMNGIERAEVVLAEFSRTTPFAGRSGVTPFEDLLSPLGLAGPVPRAVREAIYEAKSIRNVWAHRGGVADRRFVAQCPHLGFAVGEAIDLDAKTFLRLMHGLHMYAVVVANRYRDQVGMVRLVSECHGYAGCLAEIPLPSSSPSPD
jgi:hypothetical protein